jgi:hypothetical protein
MPGMVTEVAVSSGQPVKAGDKLVVLEAMKMLTTVSAGADGTVTEILVTKGDQVDSDDLLVKLKIGLVRMSSQPRFAAPHCNPPTCHRGGLFEKGKIYRVSSGEKLQRGFLVVAPVCPYAKPEPRRKSCRPSISSFARDASLRPKSRSHPHL